MIFFVLVGSFYHACVPLSVLPYLATDFSGKRRTSTLMVNVCLGVLGIGLSEYDSCHNCFGGTRGICFQSNKTDI